ncbi:hypothetical protein Hanom_Chr08g00714701 [Helianthus anomalus]
MASAASIREIRRLSLKGGKITLFVYFFKFCNFRLPMTKFCKEVLDHYAIHLSHVHPLGLAKVRHFEYASLSQRHVLEILVFMAFYCLVWKAPFFTCNL